MTALFIVAFSWQDGYIARPTLITCSLKVMLVDKLKLVG